MTGEAATAAAAVAAAAAAAAAAAEAAAVAIRSAVQSVLHESESEGGRLGGEGGGEVVKNDDDDDGASRRRRNGSTGRPSLVLSVGDKGENGNVEIEVDGVRKPRPDAQKDNRQVLQRLERLRQRIDVALSSTETEDRSEDDPQSNHRPRNQSHSEGGIRSPEPILAREGEGEGEEGGGVSQPVSNVNAVDDDRGTSTAIVLDTGSVDAPPGEEEEKEEEKKEKEEEEKEEEEKEEEGGGGGEGEVTTSEWVLLAELDDIETALREHRVFKDRLDTARKAWEEVPKRRKQEKQQRRAAMEAAAKEWASREPVVNDLLADLVRLNEAAGM